MTIDYIILGQRIGYLRRKKAFHKKLLRKEQISHGNLSAELKLEK